MDCAKNIFLESIEYLGSAYEVLDNADALILLTEWNEFRHPDFDVIKSKIKDKVIFDGRNQYNKVQLKNKGLKYICFGI